MKAQVFWIKGPWQGRLGIVPRPRGGDWLEDDVKAWHNAGIHIVVSMVTPEEAIELQIENEQEYCKRQGISFRSIPITDRGTPDRAEDFLSIVKDLEAELLNGKNVTVHCRQSIGRSSLLATSVLVYAGIPTVEAFSSVEDARGCPVPDTNEQRTWVEEFAEYTVSPRNYELPFSLQNRQ